MAKKKERIVEQVFRSEFRREEGGAAIIRGLGYLKNSDFHSIVFCESKELKRRERRILLLPRHIKSMFDGAAAEHEMLASELKKLRQENEQLMKSAIEHEALMLDLQSQIAENSRLQEENSQQQKNIEHLKKNMLRPWNRWVILAGFRVGVLLDLIVTRSRKEPIEFPA